MAEYEGGYGWPAEWVDKLAQILDEQGTEGTGHWNDSDETFVEVHGWTSQAAFRQAMRANAAEILENLLPWVLLNAGDALANAPLKQVKYRKNYGDKGNLVYGDAVLHCADFIKRWRGNDIQSKPTS